MKSRTLGYYVLAIFILNTSIRVSAMQDESTQTAVSQPRHPVFAPLQGLLTTPDRKSGYAFDETFDLVCTMVVKQQNLQKSRRILTSDDFNHELTEILAQLRAQHECFLRENSVFYQDIDQETKRGLNSSRERARQWSGTAYQPNASNFEDGERSLRENIGALVSILDETIAYSQSPWHRRIWYRVPYHPDMWNNVNILRQAVGSRFEKGLFELFREALREQCTIS